MATEIWLGGVLLPPVNWIGDPGEYPESYKKNFDSATMLDGRIRYNFNSASQRSWTLEWAMLTKENIDILQGLADARNLLQFNHGMTAQKVWRAVAVKSFLTSALLATFRMGSVCKYKASMMLEESI